MERLDRHYLRERLYIAITVAPRWTTAPIRDGLKDRVAFNSLIEKICDVVDGYNHGVFVIEKKEWMQPAKPIDADAAKKGP